MSVFSYNKICLTRIKCFRTFIGENEDNVNNDYTFHKAPLLENKCSSNITIHINAILKISLSDRQ